MTGRAPAELIGPPLPDYAAEVWHWFTQLNRTRSAGFGYSPISYTEMQAFFDLMGISPQPWEVELLQTFDKLSLQASREENNGT